MNTVVWKKVSVELPQDGQEVLCYWSRDFPYEIAIFGEGGRWGTIWQTANGDMHRFDADPTHWAELPDPPADGI